MIFAKQLHGFHNRDAVSQGSIDSQVVGDVGRRVLLVVLICRLDVIFGKALLVSEFLELLFGRFANWQALRLLNLFDNADQFELLFISLNLAFSEELEGLHEHRLKRGHEAIACVRCDVFVELGLTFLVTAEKQRDGDEQSLLLDISFFFKSNEVANQVDHIKSYKHCLFLGYFFGILFPIVVPVKGGRCLRGQILKFYDLTHDLETNDSEIWIDV